jgi:hypothetical protein
MRVFQSIIVLVMVFLWMPVTLHCGLEAAGILGADACCDETESCSDDFCAEVEDGDYTSVSHQPRVSAPAQLTCSAFLIFPSVGTSPPVEEATWSESMEASLDWLSDWHFVRRTAFPARAPSLNA